MARDNKLYSGFVRHDYILTFVIEDEANRARLVGALRRALAGRRGHAPHLGDPPTR